MSPQPPGAARQLYSFTEQLKDLTENKIHLSSQTQVSPRAAR